MQRTVQCEDSPSDALTDGPVLKPLVGSNPSTWSHELLNPSLPMGRGPRERLFWELLFAESGVMVALQRMGLGRLLGC